MKRIKTYLCRQLKRRNGDWYDKIYIGKYAESQKKIAFDDIENFVNISGDFNPFHIDEKSASNGPFKKVIA